MMNIKKRKTYKNKKEIYNINNEYDEYEEFKEKNLSIKIILKI